MFDEHMVLGERACTGGCMGHAAGVKEEACRTAVLHHAPMCCCPLLSTREGQSMHALVAA